MSSRERRNRRRRKLQPRRPAAGGRKSYLVAVDFTLRETPEPELLEELAALGFTSNEPPTSPRLVVGTAPNFDTKDAIISAIRIVEIIRARGLASEDAPRILRLGVLYDPRAICAPKVLLDDEALRSLADANVSLVIATYPSSDR